MGPVSYCSRDKRRFLSKKIAQFSHPSIFNALPHWNYVTVVAGSKNRMIPLAECRKRWRCVHSFRQNTGIGRIDWRTERNGRISRSMTLCTLTATKSETEAIWRLTSTHGESRSSLKLKNWWTLPIFWIFNFTAGKLAACPESDIAGYCTWSRSTGRSVVCWDAVIQFCL